MFWMKSYQQTLYSLKLHFESLNKVLTTMMMTYMPQIDNIRCAMTFLRFIDTLLCISLEKVVETVTYVLRPVYDRGIQPDDPYPSPVLGETACGWPRYDCSDYASSKYRTIDGSCNNLDNPNWGKANIPFVRTLPPMYGDGRSNSPTLPIIIVGWRQIEQYSLEVGNEIVFRKPP